MLARYLSRFKWARRLAGDIVERWFRGRIDGSVGYAEKREWGSTLRRLRTSDGDRYWERNRQ